MRKNIQLSMTGKGLKNPGDCFGGSLLKGNPKSRRPLDSKMPVHLVLKSNLATMRTPIRFGRIHNAVYSVAEKYGFRVYKYANVGNHLHVVIRISKVQFWPAFIRELTGSIALIAGQEGARFWKHRPFTRIIRSWKKAFHMALDYVELNQLEADGHIKRSEIRSLTHLRQLFSSS
jgi:REP element-mobilizing transposase RayT